MSVPLRILPGSQQKDENRAGFRMQNSLGCYPDTSTTNGSIHTRATLTWASSFVLMDLECSNTEPPAALVNKIMDAYISSFIVTYINHIKQAKNFIAKNMEASREEEPCRRQGPKMCAMGGPAHSRTQWVTESNETPLPPWCQHLFDPQALSFPQKLCVNNQSSEFDQDFSVHFLDRQGEFSLQYAHPSYSI